MHPMDQGNFTVTPGVDTIGPPPERRYIREDTLKHSWEDSSLPQGREDPEEYPSFVVVICLFVVVLLMGDDKPKKDDNE